MIHANCNHINILEIYVLENCFYKVVKEKVDVITVTKQMGPLADAT